MWSGVKRVIVACPFPAGRMGGGSELEVGVNWTVQELDSQLAQREILHHGRCSNQPCARAAIDSIRTPSNYDRRQLIAFNGVPVGGRRAGTIA